MPPHDPPTEPRFHLICLQGAERGDRYPLGDGSTLAIGRDPGIPGIAIRDLLASRRHATIAVADARVIVEDQASANGTRINGKPITSPTELHDGDIVTIGHTSLALDDAEAASSSDLLYNSDHSGERALRSRLKRRLERHRTASEQSQDPAPDAGGDSTLLADLLAALPLALLLFETSGRILLTNDRLRDLIATTEALPGHEAAPVIAALTRQLRLPDDLHTALAAADGRPQRMALIDGDAWLVWVQHLADRRILFILPG